MAGLGVGVVSVVDGDCDNSGDELTAELVVFVVVLGTFSSTAVASIGTNRAQLQMQIGSATHKSGTKSAKIGAIAAGFDAGSHHLHHVTIQTGSGAKFTVLEAFKAGFNTSFELRVTRLSSSHQITPKKTSINILMFVVIIFTDNLE